MLIASLAPDVSSTFSHFRIRVIQIFIQRKRIKEKFSRHKEGAFNTLFIFSMQKKSKNLQ